MRRALHFTAAGVAAILSAACGQSSGTISAPTTVTLPAGAGATGSQSTDATTWKLVSINGRPALAGVRADATFDQNRVTGVASCNRYMGGAVVSGEQVKMSLMASTMMYCGAQGVMEQEYAYLSALEKATIFRVVGSELQLGPAAGTVTLVYGRQ